MRVLFVNDPRNRGPMLDDVLESFALEMQVSSVDNLDQALVTLSSAKRRGGEFEIAVINLNGTELSAIPELSARYPSLKVLAFSFNDDAKQTESVIAKVMLAVSALGTRTPCESKRPERRADQAIVRPPGPPKVPQNQDAFARAVHSRLTRRQKQVLKLICEGYSTKEIARSLNIATGTVKVHTAAIFRELGVSNRTQAATNARSLFAASDSTAKRESSGSNFVKPPKLLFDCKSIEPDETMRHVLI